MLVYFLIGVLGLGLIDIEPVTATSSGLIRGVKKKDVGLYSGSSFQCFDKSNTIPIEYINDEYCDCNDGSDEPGTNACISSKFWCSNKGAKPHYIYSSRVNDGICDCCDGTDEYSSSSTACPNTCEQLGISQLAGLRSKIQETEKGIQLREEWINQAKSLNQERTNRLAKLEAKLIDRKRLAEEAKIKKEQEEALEKEENDRRTDEAEKARLLAEALLANATGDAEAASSAPAEQVNQEAHEASSSPSSSSSPSPPVDSSPAAPQDEKVEAAVEAFPYPAEYAFKPESAATTADDPKIGEAGSAFPYPAEYAAPPATQTAGVTSGDSSQDEEQDDEPYIPSSFGAENAGENTEYTSPAAQAARDAFSEANSKVSKTEDKIADLKKLLSHDYGVEGVFSALEGKCFEIRVKQYTYEMCPYGEAKQKEGHSSTSLGSWKGLTQKFVDGKEVIVFEFTGGQSCWQGPQRSLSAELRCGPDNAALSVDEPSKCVYVMQFQTPAVCTPEDVADLNRQLQKATSESDE